ncbi:bifunctional sugar phosphate isomerase/epimerase/4-hydroxyphenylpyruvate dioxygenase family protein [Variovorax sp. OV329]|uniref:bifunctional sugar phosphate isomerase/epimerase/4-hydroxyphenylpyruvate dioxygenase family protein n=1 Tax=Variovorax sp. OV329 TaxID=1882825 RepID=UPI000B8641E2|nr:sugar phosphate isomerase/epimerase and 4-hydroxyphenylpyruvate domain-containing protein [Variovorax sp. OV329]
MRRSIATVSLSGTLRQKLEAIAAAGFEGYELFEPDFIQFQGSAKELRQIGSDLGLTLDLFQPLRDFEAMPPAQFQRNLERAERKFDLMQEMGAELLLVCSSTSPLVIDDAELAAAQLRELAERAARRGLRVGFEALAWGRVTSRWSQAWDIVQRAGHPALGLILDSFHTLSLRDDFAGIAQLPGDRIFFVQMADAPLLAMDVLQWARHHRCFPGQGELPVFDFFEQVLRSGYQGNLSLEIFNDIFRETPNRRTAVDAMRSLLFLESEMRVRVPEASPALGLFDPPPAPTLDGIRFIEFAADEKAAADLDGLFTTMGFSQAGQHRSKAVKLYRQGDIHFIVNAQPGSHARERFELAKDCTVCALGIGSPDPMSAVARATQLLSRWHDSPVGPGEMRVPATVMPGGNLMHFVDTVEGVEALFKADFVPEPADPKTDAQGVGLARVDHVALGLAPDQLHTWMLFARSVLGLEAGESLELADPFGLVQSRGLANADRSVRLVLNASTSQSTQLARGVSARGGGAVHHIALATADIFGAVAALRERGLPFVPISDNYYDDLPTRLDLAPGLLARLRAHGVLLDRSSGGDYLHAYTPPLAGGFFFELVQRDAEYDGYGAANAPARLASQAQQAS